MRTSLLALALIGATALACAAEAGPSLGPSRCGPMPRARGPWRCVEAIKPGSNSGSGPQQHKPPQVKWVWVRG